MPRLILSFCFMLVLVSAADAQFETRSASPVTPTPDAIAVGDFNHDGKLDLAVADLFIDILLGNGDGTFYRGAQYTVPFGENSILAADLRNNGIQDLVVTSHLGQDVYVLLGNGDGTFAAPVSFPTESYTSGNVEVGNFTGDKTLDIITCTDVIGTGSFITVLPGNGDGTFRAGISTAVPNDTGCGVLGVGRFTASSNLDLALPGEFGSAGLNIMLGNGDGTFRAFGFYPIAVTPVGVALADFNKDGNLDVAISSGAAGMQVFLGNGDGTFQPSTSYPSPSLGPLVAGDLNGDGNLDLVAPTANNGVAVFLGNGDGTFQPYVPYPAGQGDEFVAVGDFNNDGKLDIVNAAFNNGAVFTLLNTGVVSFSPTTPISFPFQLLGTTSKQKSVTLTNTGTTALTISSMKVSGPFTMTSSCGSSVAAGASCNIKVTFSPKSKGLNSGLITINDSASSKLQVIELSGQGTVVEFSPTKLNFGTQKVGTKSAPQTVTFTNTGTTALSITTIAAGGTDAKDFSQTNNCPASLDAGSSCTITVNFDPRKSGTRQANINATDNGGGSPQTVLLSGTGS